MKLAWQVKQFAELSVDELYLIWQLREQVFVVEQQAIYLDADGADLSAAHLLVKNGSELSAYLRILPPDANGVVHFGRVLVRASQRGSGLGRKIVLRAIDEIYKRYGFTQEIQIAAQQYLLEFYQSLGFQSYSAPYVTEDGIPHINMRICT